MDRASLDPNNYYGLTKNQNDKFNKEDNFDYWGINIFFTVDNSSNYHHKLLPATDSKH